MTIDWVLMLPALLMLLWPGDRLIFSDVELLSFDRMGNRSERINRRRWVYVRWLDPIRAFGGAFLLKISLPLTTDLWLYLPGKEYGLFVTVLGLGMIAQLFTRRETGVLLAPVGYGVGMLFALVPWPEAAVAVISGITSLFAFRQVGSFFGFAAMVVGLVGMLFETPIIWLLPAVGMLLTPVVAGLITGRSLEIPVPAETRAKQ
jgi:hypothetical protein